MTYFRIQQADRDPSALLDPEHWFSAPWNGFPLRDCAGCADCVADDWYIRERHMTCDGTGTVEEIRYGVSVCRSVEDLINYFAHTDGDLTDVVLVELNGTLSGDTGHDTEIGEVLITPTEVVSVQPLPAEVENAICAAWDIKYAA